MYKVVNAISFVWKEYERSNSIMNSHLHRLLRWGSSAKSCLFCCMILFEPQVCQRDSNSPNEMEIIEGLMQTHDVTLSNLPSRLTKLQMVRHFVEWVGLMARNNSTFVKEVLLLVVVEVVAWQNQKQQQWLCSQLLLCSLQLLEDCFLWCFHCCLLNCGQR